MKTYEQLSLMESAEQTAQQPHAPAPPETTDVSALPPGWRVAKLGEVCLDVEKTKASLHPPDKEFIYLDINAIDNTRQKIVEPKRYAWQNAPSRAQMLVREGDIIFSTVRTYLKNIALVDSVYHNQIASTGFCVIRPDKVLESTYCYYYTQSHTFLHSLNELQRGTSYPAVRNKDVFEQNIPLPPLPEQHRIVAKIEELFSEIDRGVEQLEAVRAQLKVYRQAVLKYAFEGKLTETWRAAQPHLPTAQELLAGIKNERDKKYAEECEKAKAEGKKPPKKPKELPPLTADELAALPELPEGWAWVKIGSTTDCLDFMRIPVNKNERLKRKGNIPYYGANGQVGWIDDYIFDEELILVVEDETFTGREKPFAYKISGKTWVNNHAHVLRPLALLDVNFLNYQLWYYPFTALTTGTTGRKKLTRDALVNAPFRTCTLKEQHAIVAEIESRLSVCDSVEQSIEQALQQSAVLRQSILQRAFAGQLVPQKTA